MQYKINLRTALLTLALVAIAGIPVTARALGLGKLQSDTRIGQPFSARIPITGANASVLQGLHVELASPEAYKNANLTQPDYLYSLKFSVEQGSKGPYIKVSSDKPVRLPFLNLLINARWNSGQVTRQFTVLLNPPVFVAGSQSQQPVNAPSSPARTQQPTSSPTPTPQPAAPAQPAPVKQPVASQPVQQQPVQPTQTMPAATTGPSASAPQQQMSSSAAPSTYTVQHGDTLWGLSRRIRPSSEISVNQMMVALYQANPHAFRGNINRLKSGAVLQMPSQSQIAQITAEEATRIVARQNNEWQGAQPSTQVASSNTAAKNASGASQAGASQGTGGETASQAQSGEQAQAAPAGTAGRVVLTTPEVTATTSAAAAPGSAAASGTASSMAMSGAAASSAESTSQASAKSGQAAGTGASVGGPLKVQSNSMTGLAGAGTSGTAASATGMGASSKASAAAAAAKKRPQPKKVSRAANNVNSVNTVSSEESQGGNGLMYWIQQPTGWIIIGAVVLLLAALLLFIVRRRKSGSGESGRVAAVENLEDAGEGDGQDAGPEASGHIEAGIPHETEGGMEHAAEAESAGGGEGDELGIATYIGGPSLDVNKVDAIDEAELHVGFGDYGKAAEVLREAIEREPSRPQLRRKLLDVLYAAGDAAGFAGEAAIYRDQVDASEWEDVAVMGRQLLPEDELFASAAVSAAVAPAAESEAEQDDYLDIDLDRLSSETEGSSDQSEFERTMDELSTFIETYVPASSDTPVSLQLPPEEEQAMEQPKADESVELPDDEPLEFTLDDDDLPPPRADSGLVTADDDEAGDENLVDTKLDLARAYIDMGDSDSARGVLEEVIDEGDDTQSGEAKRLLESLA